MKPMKGPIAAFVCLFPPMASAQDLAPMALNSFSTPPAGLASAAVVTPRGQAVGHVEQVTTDAQGKPSALAVASPKGRLTVPAASASYDPSRRLVVADIPAPQLAAGGH